MAQNIPRVAILGGTNHELAEEGCYYVAKNPTAGTGLATVATPTTIDDTKPYIVVKSGAKRDRFDYIRIVCTAPGTAGTSLRLVIRTDATKADPTGGTTITPVNVNQDTTSTALCSIFAGPLTAAAASGAVREIVAPLLKNSIPAVGDVYLVKFGGSDQGVSTTAGIVYYGGPPLIIGASQLAAFHLVLPSQSAASSYEVEFGLWER